MLEIDDLTSKRAHGLTKLSGHRSTISLSYHGLQVKLTNGRLAHIREDAQW
jgi:hypothetical protein